MVKKASDVSERALADDDLIPKRSHIEGKRFNVQQAKLSFSDNRDLGLHAEDKTRKRHRNLCKNYAKPFNKVLC